MKLRIAIPSLLLASTLLGCTQSGPPAPAVKPSPSADAMTSLHAIRAAGDGLDSAVQVHPFRDPAIDGFLKRAHVAEAARDFDAAITATNGALKLSPQSPEILQYLAELQIARGDWMQADALALKSFELGPKLGSLCARNWQTVVEARTATNDAATATQAQQRVKECRVAPRLRM
ncbi:MAG: tetratricopeptide repeat protein [Dokdonella sp.]